MRVFGRLRKRNRRRKVFVIGLDCAAPQLVFEQWKDDLPNLTHLRRNGLWGKLKSCIPAITVPAWSCMLSGKDPGELGIYGFRNRNDHSYDGMSIATGNAVREKRVWDYLSEAGMQSILVGVPQTYPVRPLNGHLISGFLTPGRQSEFTYPSSLKEEVLSIAPDYDVDVRQFRTEDKDWLLRQILDMTENRFRVVDHLLTSKPWDFFMIMEIGMDRIQHGFWNFYDPEHRRFQEGNPYENAIRNYYIYIDQSIGRWLDIISDDTVVIVVSDHGAQRMDGGICINEWLWREGYLAFHEDPKPGTILSFDKTDVDWKRTRAWGAGGYYGRIFLNVKDREPQGLIDPADYEALRDELAEKLEAIPDSEGRDIATKVFKPQDIYRQVKGIAPDLMVYFGNLLWRSIGSLGHGAVHTFENDIGPDGCNHAEDGMFILYDPYDMRDHHKVRGAQLMDVTATILELFGHTIPADIQGQSLIRNEPA